MAFHDSIRFRFPLATLKPAERDEWEPRGAAYRGATLGG